MPISSKKIKAVWGYQLVRFLCFGVVNATNSILLLNFFVYVFHLHVLLANIVSASISISISYVLNHYAVFQSKDPLTLRAFLHFFLITGLSVLLVQTVVIAGVIHLLGTKEIGINSLLRLLGLRPLTTQFINLNIAKLISIVFSMLWNLTLYRLIVFQSSEPEDDIAF